MMRAFFASTLIGLGLIACTAEQGELTGANPDPGTDPGTDPNNPNPAPTGTMTTPTPDQCVASPHVGFANTDFVADRKPGDIGTNRRRVKPFSSLATEYKRALGAAPTNLSTSVAAFGDQPARWFFEPDEGAVSLYTTYTLSFQACYDSMTGADYQVMPTATTASAQCASLARIYWQRTAAPDEVQACSDFITGLTTETNARRRWAHGCASLLTSTGFTTY